MKVKINFEFKFDREIIIMSVLSLCIAVASIELLFRSNETEPPIPILGLQEEFCPHPSYFEGERDDPAFRMDIDAIRRYSHKVNEKVFILGGSATQAYYLGEHETWPYMLRDLFLMDKRGYDFVNIAHSASTSFQHLKDFETACDSFPEVKKFIVVVGAADMLFAISGRDYDDLEESIFDHSAIFRDRNLIVDVKERNTKPRRDDFSPFGYVERRSNRQESKKISELPNIKGDLNDYEDNIEDLIDLAHDRNKQIMFVTEPYFWKANMSKEEKARLWTGAYFEDDDFEASAYYTTSVLAETMKQFNDRLRTVCKEEGVDCFDLATKLPRTSEVFFDGYHMHENGHARSASLLYLYLSEKEGF